MDRSKNTKASKNCHGPSYLIFHHLSSVICQLSSVLAMCSQVKPCFRPGKSLKRGTRYRWAWHKHSYETNKYSVFLETEAAFPYCNWSIKMDRIIWVGSTSVDIGPACVNNWQELGHLCFLSLCESRKFFQTKNNFFS